jgi:flagellar motor switch protein FliM
MSDEVLSQEEVDALLNGVSGDEAEAPAEHGDGNVHPYSFAAQERIVRGRMPTLEIIHERFGRFLRAGLFNFIRRSPEISVQPVMVTKYSEFVRNLVVPANINLVSAKPLRGTALFILEPTLVFAVIDNLFGGSGKAHTRAEERELSSVEMRIVRRILDIVFAEYAKAWQPVYQLAFEYQRSEMNMQFASIAMPNDMVVTTSFRIELGTNVGELTICVPYAMLEPIRELLVSGVRGQQMEVDRRWQSLLSQQIKNAQVELVTPLCESSVTVQTLLNLRVGDVIPLELSETVHASVDAVPVLAGRYGVSNGRYALRVEHIIRNGDVSQIDQGERHAAISA